MYVGVSLLYTVVPIIRLAACGEAYMGKPTFIAFLMSSTCWNFKLIFQMGIDILHVEHELSSVMTLSTMKPQAGWLIMLPAW